MQRRALGIAGLPGKFTGRPVLHVWPRRSRKANSSGKTENGNTIREDPGLKYLYLKGIITQDEYDRGLKVIEKREQVSKPNYTIDVNNGLNFRVGDGSS